METTEEKKEPDKGKTEQTEDPKGDRLTFKEARELTRKIRSSKSGLIRTRSWRLTRYPNVITGSDLVDWMIKEGIAKDREEAVEKGKILVAEKQLRHVYEQHDFKDEYLFFRFKEDEEHFDGPTCQEAIAKSSLHGQISVKGVVKWNDRYLVLNADEKKLYYYGTDKDSSPKSIMDLTLGCINLNECVACKPGNYCFNLVDQYDKLFTCCAKESKVQEAWIDALSKAGVNFIEEDVGVKASSIFDFNVKNIVGEDVSLSKYENKVCLIVNVASQ